MGLSGFYAAFGILGTLNLAPLPLDGVFQPLVFVFVTINDLIL